MHRLNTQPLILVSLGALSCACLTDDTQTLAAVGGAAALTQTDADSAAGADLFFKPFPDAPSNGRACGTCHVSDAAFQLTPAHVEAHWQALQRARAHDPTADDPLFRAIDADDHKHDFTLLREHALVRVVIDLPTDADGNKLVWPVDDPDAKSVEVFRAVPSIRNVALTAPYQYDGRFTNLQEQALRALHAHAEVACAPDARTLADIAAFESEQFSSPLPAAGDSAADESASLTELEQHGKELFDRDCGVCHGGPRKLEPIAAVAKIPGFRDIFLSQPVPAFAADLPFPKSAVADRARIWAVKVPGQDQPVRRESTDPGIVLQTGNIDNFNEFDIPSLLGIRETAPYFRDNSAATLHDVIFHYQQLFEAARRVPPSNDPAAPPPPAPILDDDFEPLIAYLETL